MNVYGYVFSSSGRMLQKHSFPEFSVSEDMLLNDAPQGAVVLISSESFDADTTFLEDGEITIKEKVPYQPTLMDIKARKWAEIKSQRDQLEFGGFEFEGNVYDSDQVSQGRIMGAAVAGVDQTWTLANNTTVELTALQLQQLYAALQSHIAGAHERGRIARQLIFEAETKEQVEAIQL